MMPANFIFPSPMIYIIYTNSKISLPIRQLPFCTLSESLTFSTLVRPFCLL